MTRPFGIIRPFTPDDQDALNASAKRFASRHLPGLALDATTPAWQLVTDHLWARPATWGDTRSLRRAWQSCKCRALGVDVSAKVDVAYGYIGYWAK